MRACLSCLLLICAVPAHADDIPRFKGNSLPEWVKELGAAEERDRVNAIEALEQFGAAAKEAVPALVQMLKDRGNGNETPNTLSTIGQAAVEALAQVGPPAVPALLKQAIQVLGRTR